MHFYFPITFSSYIPGTYGYSNRKREEFAASKGYKFEQIWILTENGFEVPEKFWRTGDNKLLSYLEFKPIDEANIIKISKGEVAN